MAREDRLCSSGQAVLSLSNTALPPKSIHRNQLSLIRTSCSSNARPSARPFLKTWEKTSGGCCPPAATLSASPRTATSTHPKRSAKRTGRTSPMNSLSPPVERGEIVIRAIKEEAAQHDSVACTLQLTRFERVNLSPGIWRSCLRGSALGTGCRSRKSPWRRCSPPYPPPRNVN